MIGFAWIVFFALFAASLAAGHGFLPAEVAGYSVEAITGGAAVLLLIPLLIHGYRQRHRRAGAVVKSGPAAGTPEANARAAEAAARKAEVARNASALQGAAAPSSPAADPKKVRIDGHDGHYLEVETKRLEDGTVEVTVTAFNYSGNRFHNHVRERLERIKAAQWSKPINLGKGDSDRRRQMKGITTDGSLPVVMAGIATIR